MVEFKDLLCVEENKTLSSLFTTSNNMGPMPPVPVGGKFRLKRVTDGLCVEQESQQAPVPQPGFGFQPPPGQLPNLNLQVQVQPPPQVQFPNLNPQVPQIQLAQQGQPQYTLIHKMTWKELRAIETLMTHPDVLYTASGYGDVKQNKYWREVHRIERRAVKVFFKQDNQIYEGIAPESGYCKGCGLVLPLVNLEVDHRRPQAGGAPSALFKLMRAVGLAKVNGRGLKAKTLPTMFEDQAFTIHRIKYTVDPKEPPKGDLNWSGVIVYTLAVASGRLDALAKQSLSHFVNLQPMCSPCNRQKSNFIPTLWRFPSYLASAAVDKKRKVQQ